MHDPKTVAFDIPNIFTKPYAWSCKPGQKRQWPALVTIWHVDPEKGGDDDSCGFSFVNLTEEDTDWATARAKEEWPFWFSERYERINMRGASDLACLALVWGEARHRATRKPRNVELSAWDQAQLFALMACPGDNFGHLVEDAKQSEEGLARLLALTLRYYKTRRRPWWQKPRWHVHHWQIQVHPLQKFCRWMWSRCAGCGRRFRWGYAPVSNSWHGKGPRWFRGEQGVFHRECCGGKQ